MIYIRDVTKIPGYLIDNGMVALDLATEDFTLRVTRKLGELTQFNKLKVDGVLEFTVNRTEKNDIIFANQLSLNSMCYTYGGIFVDVIDGGIHYTEDFVTVLAFDDKTITLELSNSNEHWLNAIKIKTLKDINYSAFGVFDFTLDNIYDNFINGFEWQDNEFLGHFAPAWYGQNRVKEEDGGTNAKVPINVHTANDLRPFISVLGTIRKSLCEERWNFRSPFLESPKGRRLWAYVNSPEYWKTEGINYRGRMINFRASFVATGGLPFWTSSSGPIPFQDDSTSPNFDLGNTYDNSGVGTPRWMWTNPLPFAHLMTFGVRLVLNSLVAETITILIKRQNGTMVVDDIIETFDMSAGETRVVNFEWDTVCQPNDVVFVASIKGRIMDGSTFYGNTAGKMIYAGDYVDLGECVKDYLFMDFFRGVIHMMEGRLETDWVTKTVWLHIPEDSTEFDGSIVPGFYHSDEDLTPIVISGSRKVKIDRDKRYKKYIAKWADSTDSEIERLEKTETLHSKEIILDNEYSEEWVDENPFFEPTLNGELRTKNQPRGILTGIDAPWFIDNQEEKISYEIGPRILLSLGYVAQSTPENSDGITDTGQLSWLFQNPLGVNGYDVLYLTPYLAQKPNHTQWVSLLKPNQLFNVNLAYGNEPFDLYQQYRQVSVLEELLRYDLEFLVKYEYNNFFLENFRKRKFINYENTPLILKLHEIRDFDGRSPSPAVFRLAASVPSDGPCDCYVRTCNYYQPFTNAITQVELDKYKVTSLKVNDTEYATAPPYSLGTKSTVVISGQTYLQNLPALLRTFNIDYYTWNNKVDTSDTCKTCWFQAITPACDNWEIIIQYNGVNKYRWTRDGFFIWKTTTWTQKIEDAKILPRPKYCVTEQKTPPPCFA